MERKGNMIVMNKLSFDFILDINECETGVHGCSQMCINVDGGFNCACYFGFTLRDDRETCEKGWLQCKKYNCMHLSLSRARALSLS